MLRTALAFALAVVSFAGCGAPNCPAPQVCAQGATSGQVCRQDCSVGLDGGSATCPTGTVCKLAPICCATPGGCPGPQVSVCCPPSGC
jgi:hypothetical protein